MTEETLHEETPPPDGDPRRTRAWRWAWVLCPCWALPLTLRITDPWNMQ